MANISMSLSITEGDQGRNLEVGAEAEAIEELRLLVCSTRRPSCYLPLFTDAMEDPLPRDGTTHSGMGPPMSIINQENAP